MLAIDITPLAHAKLPLAIDTRMLAIYMMPLAHAKTPLAIDSVMFTICVRVSS